MVRQDVVYVVKLKLERPTGDTLPRLTRRTRFAAWECGLGVSGVSVASEPVVVDLDLQEAKSVKFRTVQTGVFDPA